MDDFALQRLTHLYALNRGVLLTPFHNMALMCPATTDEDVDRHTEVFAEMADELLVPSRCLVPLPAGVAVDGSGSAPA